MSTNIMRLYRMLLITVLAAGAAGAAVHVTPAGVTYVVRAAGATDALLPGDGLLVSFSCFNRSSANVDGPEIFAASRIVAVDAGGAVHAPATQPLGIWDGPSYIPPNSSVTSTVDVGALFPAAPVGKYVVRWEVDGGAADVAVNVFAAADYYPYRLLHDETYNDWGLHVYGEDGAMGAGLGRDAVKLGKALVPKLVTLTGEQREAFIVGSEDATIGAMYGWRVCDFAGILLCEIWGMPPEGLRSRDVGERDARLAQLRAYYRLHK